MPNLLQPSTVYNLPTIEQIGEALNHSPTPSQEAALFRLIDAHIEIIFQEIENLPDLKPEMRRIATVADNQEQFVDDCKAIA